MYHSDGLRTTRPVVRSGQAVAAHFSSVSRGGRGPATDGANTFENYRNTKYRILYVMLVMSFTLPAALTLTVTLTLTL